MVFFLDFLGRYNMRRGAWLGACSCLVLASVFCGEREAAACGGCFTPPPPPPPPGAPPGSVDSVITAERMIFSISKDQTTLYDEITYSGSPSSFAWVLPIRGEVTVGLSADVLFAVVDGLTAVVIDAPPTNCPSPPASCGYFGGGGGGGGGCAFGASGSESGFDPSAAVNAAADAATTADAGVSIIAQAQVGPYETVQLRSNDGSALTNWLDGHGYRVPASDAQIIAHYVAEGMDFLALKLVPGEGVQSMQPVRVTTKGASPVLPLRMVGVGTGPTTGITLWVVADGRWGPQNFPFFTLEPDELVWDWTTSSSNYESLRLKKETALKGAGWQIESSIELNRAIVSSTLDQAIGENYAGIGGYSTTIPAPPADAGSDASPDADAEVDAGKSADAGATDAESDGGPSDAPAEAKTTVTDARPPADASKGRDSSGGAPVTPNAYALAAEDLDVLFAGIAGPNARFTRMRGDIAHSALSSDLVVEATQDTSEVSNVYPVTHENAQPLCTVYNASCSAQPNELPRDQAIAYENQVESQLEAQNTSNGGGCACKTSGTSQSWRTTVAILVAFAGLGGLRTRQRRRGRR
jgi:hypothetical protein